MRLSYLAPGSSGLGRTSKVFCQGDLKKVARYMLGTKHLALHLWRQTFPKCISTYVDCKDNTSKDPFSQCEQLQGIHIQVKSEYVGTLTMTEI